MGKENGWKRGVKATIPVSWGAQSIRLQGMSALESEYAQTGNSLECEKCGSMRREVFPGGKVRKCKKCGHVWGGTIPTEEEISAIEGDIKRGRPKKLKLVQEAPPTFTYARHAALKLMVQWELNRIDVFKEAFIRDVCGLKSGNVRKAGYFKLWEILRKIKEYKNDNCR